MSRGLGDVYKRQEKDKVTIQATVVHGTGIKMTLLSQGSWVKVLSPQSFVDEMKQESKLIWSEQEDRNTASSMLK